MKNLRLGMLIPSLIFASCDGQNGGDKDIAPGRVPPLVVAAFHNKYPGAADVTWEREMDGADTVYEATFRHEGKRMDAEFDKTGAPAEND